MIGVVWTAMLWGCGGEAPAPEPDVPEQCKNVHVDRMDTDWIRLQGKAPDPTTRIRITKAGDGYEAWYSNGFARRTLKGEKRQAGDVKFTEAPSAARKARFDKGEGTLVRMYLKPSLKDCALQAFIGEVDKADKEAVPPRPAEFLLFPKKMVDTFAFAPRTEDLFLGEAATDAAKAAKQVEEHGGPNPEHEMGTVVGGLFTDAASDGAADCTYDFDVYFDDKRVEGASNVAAGEVKDGQRPWSHSWEAPFSGNHLFELHRFRTCGGKDRERIGVASIESVLM